jgi:hypothetical protein
VLIRGLNQKGDFMIKKLMIISLAVFLALPAIASELARKSVPHVDRIITGDEPLPNKTPIPWSPNAATQSPGTVVGTTYFDYQTNGSSGNRIAVGNDGSVFFAWTNGLNWERPRKVYFNRIDEFGEWYSTGIGDNVFNDSVTGYCQVAMAYGNRGVIACHAGANVFSQIAIDSDPPGFGIFNIYNAPDLVSGNRRTIWPYVAVDRNNLVHLVMSENSNAQNPQRLCYARFNQSTGTWWPSATNPQFIDSVKTISGVIAASPVSDKVVIAYTKMTDSSSQTWNDVCYVLSQDGTTWDFTNGRINVTNYGDDDDSLWAYTDAAVIFDYNDNFHIVWNANWSPTANSYYYRTYLFHYNSGRQIIDEVRTPWPDSLWLGSGCDCGGWNRPICKMDLGVQPVSNILAVVWTQFDTSDCSAAGYANGDIWLAYTADGGVNWSSPTNVTNSHTPNCEAGDCDSDHWPSLADVISGNFMNGGLKLFYVNDKDAGGMPQTEGSPTENPMMYHPIVFGNIDDKPALPANFTLAQNYPNPFNSNTNISFELKTASSVKLEIFDLAGAKVATLVNQQMASGTHQVTWNAEEVASGTYYYRLTAGKEVQTKQMVYVK